MARFRSLVAVYVDYGCIGKIPAGSTIADSQANSQPGDRVWPVTAASLPRGYVPLDASASVMLAASPWAGLPFQATILGVDSIG
jgi:hypothetical protein